MASATLQITIAPKRMLTKAEAAAHCGRPVKRFEVECTVTSVKFPNGDRRYDVRDLDHWLDGFKEGNFDGADDIIEKLK
jgi:hypothetical protein